MKILNRCIMILGGLIMLFSFAACANGGETAVVKDTALKFSAVPSGILRETYSKCVVVYDSKSRIYEQNAARVFYDFLKLSDAGDDFIELVKEEDFKGVGQGALAVYIGSLSSEYSVKAGEGLTGDGYVIWCEKDKIAVRGSNAENTYYAVSKLVNSFFHGNPDILSNIKSGQRYKLECAVDREDYIADITKFPAVWQYEWQPPAWTADFDKKLSDFTAAGGRPIASAHRGDLESYPENSIESIISAVLKGADMIEIDCEFTKDGVIVLNHGPDLAPTTDFLKKYGKMVNGVQLPLSRYIYDWTYEQLCQLSLRTGNGEYSDSASEICDFKIATLEEAFTVCKERAFLSLDKLESGGLDSPHWPAVYALIKKTGAYRCPLYINMAANAQQASALRNAVLSEFGIAGPTLYERPGMRIGYDWFAEFSLETDAEFKQFFDSKMAEGANILQVNRLSKLIDWIDKYYV